MRAELWRGCGELVVLDLVLNNYDRLPAVWDNVGNTANVFYLPSGGAVGIDQALNPIIAGPGLDAYLAKVGEDRR